MTPRATFAIALTLLTTLLAAGGTILLFATPALAGGGAAATPAFDPGMGYLAAALATGLSSV
ncbi:MAG: H+transporting two-sector ATPase C subunit, partial [Magnetococcales bacterium]|nr:H+transporting two-sector ATPase C subunit [Magnetococcales bacterium]